MAQELRLSKKIVLYLVAFNIPSRFLELERMQRRLGLCNDSSIKNYINLRKIAQQHYNGT